jgi:hypothetical protein
VDQKRHDRLIRSRVVAVRSWGDLKAPAWGLAVVVALALAACSDGASAPTAAPPVVSATTVTPTVTASGSPAPVLPDAAKKPTRPGAEAFFRYFMAVYAHSLESLDTRALAALSEGRCSSCATVVASIADARAQGDQFSGGAVTVVVAVAAPDNPTAGLLLQSVINQTAVIRVGRDGTKKATVPAMSGQRVDAALRWNGSAWRVLALQYLKAGA